MFGHILSDAFTTSVIVTVPDYQLLQLPHSTQRHFGKFKIHKSGYRLTNFQTVVIKGIAEVRKCEAVGGGLFEKKKRGLFEEYGTDGTDGTWVL